MALDSDGRSRPEASGRDAARRLRPICAAALATLLATLCCAASALGATRIYWANGSANKISFANLDGSGGGDLETGSATVSSPLALALDPAVGRIYWINNGTPGSISFADLDGSGGGDLNTGGEKPELALGLAIDPAAGRLYWSSTVKNKISYANVDGSGGGEVQTGQATVETPAGIAIDPAAGRLYWGSFSAGPSFANLDGSGGGNLFIGAATMGLPEGIAIDPVARRLYWISLGSDEISYANLDGTGGVQVPIAGKAPAEVAGIAIDPAAARLYWAEGTFEKIAYASLDGSDRGEVDTSAATPGYRTFPVLLEAPVAVAPPAISATAAGPAPTLTCAGARWAADLPGANLFRAPHEVSYGWSRDGVAVAGAGGNSLAATAPGRYRCTASASNAAGTTIQTSAPHTVAAPVRPAPPAAAPAPPHGTAHAARIARVKRGQALLRLRCVGPGSCDGLARLTFKRERGRRGKGRHEGKGRTAGWGEARANAARYGSTKRKPILLGEARFSIVAGRQETVRVKFSRRARKLVKHAGRRGLKSHLAGSGVKHRTVVLKPQRRRRKPHFHPRAGG